MSNPSLAMHDPNTCPYCHGNHSAKDCPPYEPAAPPRPAVEGDEFGKVCEHGSLKRQCPHCEAEKDARRCEEVIAMQSAQITSLSAQLADNKKSVDVLCEENDQLYKRNAALFTQLAGARKALGEATDVIASECDDLELVERLRAIATDKERG